MKNLHFLSDDPELILSDIIRAKSNLEGNKRKDRLTRLETDIKALFSTYQGHFQTKSLENLKPFGYSGRNKKDLQHCFKPSTTPLSKAISKLKSIQVPDLRGTCQFCAINTDTTSDHYLPQGEFPEFAVMVLNLFPCCSDCNSLKNEYWIDSETSTRGIINLYLDELPNAQFLFANITYSEDIPLLELDLENRNGIDKDLFNIIEKHFNRLNLIERYKDKFNNLHSHVVKPYKDNPLVADNSQLVKSMILHEVGGLRETFGHNYWHAVIKEALANSDEFLRRLNTQTVTSKNPIQP